jgi:hypothetical protein
VESSPASAIPRSEYPRPQFRRADWLCLNGEWQFEIDQGDSGWERGLAGRPLKERIEVPFCPESALSGIGNTDFMNAVWYQTYEGLIFEKISSASVCLFCYSCSYSYVCVT